MSAVTPLTWLGRSVLQLSGKVVFLIRRIERFASWWPDQSQAAAGSKASNGNGLR